MALQHVVAQIQKFLDSDTARPEARRRAARCWRRRCPTCRRWSPTLTGYLLDSQENARELYRVGLESVPFLLAVGDLLIGWLLLRQAEIALQRPRR